jgi:hypothetical protein
MSEVLTEQAAKFGSVANVIPYVGQHGTSPQLLPGGGRLLKTHEPYQKGCKKAVYLLRDPRDVVVSEYHYQKRIRVYDKTFGDFVVEFVKGKTNQFCSWYEHVKSWLTAGSGERLALYVVKYEDMRHRTRDVVGEVLDFLGVSVNENVVENAIRNNTIEKMREKEDSVEKIVFKNSRQDIRFVRQGAVEGWLQTLSADQVRLIEECTWEILEQFGYKETLRNNLAKSA